MGRKAIKRDRSIRQFLHDQAVNHVDDAANSLTAIGQRSGASQDLDLLGVDPVGRDLVIRRCGRGVNRTDAIGQHEHALGAKAPQDRTAGTLAEEGGRHASLARERVAKRAGKFLDEFGAIDRGGVANHLIGFALGADTGDDDGFKGFWFGGLLRKSERACAQQERGRDHAACVLGIHVPGVLQTIGKAARRQPVRSLLLGDGGTSRRRGPAGRANPERAGNRRNGWLRRRGRHERSRRNSRQYDLHMGNRRKFTRDSVMLMRLIGVGSRMAQPLRLYEHEQGSEQCDPSRAGQPE